MKKLLKREKLMAEINITPFTDVVLVLLIIFMVTTPMLLQPGIKINLPKATKAETDSEKTVNILIDKNGVIYLNEKKTDVKNLGSSISARLSENSDIPIVIKGDKQVKYDIVIQVIDIAKQAGAKKFALAVELQQNPIR